MKEIWKPIPGFKGYEASSLGQIKALASSVKHKQRLRGKNGGSQDFRIVTKRKKEKILKPINCPSYGSYNRLRVSLSKPLKKAEGFYVHRLVWMAFNGEIPKGKVINHIDFNPMNNDLQNLEVVSHRENMAHSARGGRWIKKITHLTETDILVIRKSERKWRVIGRLFNIKESHVGDIKRGRAYSWVTGAL